MSGYTDINTLLPGGSPSTGDSVPATWFQAVRDDFELVAPWGEWTTYTPTLAQGGSSNISKTVNLAKWMRIGRLVKVRMVLSPTGAGTANNAVTVSLPVNASGHASGSQYEPVGTGAYGDTGIAQYPLMVVLLPSSSVSTVRFIRQDATFANYFGIDPNMAVASGDFLTCGFEYEAAADA